MTDQGFVLQRIELFNWGNFQGWQVAEVSASPGAGFAGPLFGREQVNALLLGVNGAGKSTLIDALIIALLPFEQAVKLGVVHDLEKGASSGRTIPAYVLGKHGSTGEGDFDPKSVYSRDSGMSSVLLVFRHRGDPARVVTIGRSWWYSGYKLREDSAGIVGHGDFSLGPNNWGAPSLLGPEGRPYRTMRELKQDVQMRALSLQVFDRVSAYFQALSSQFGGVKKEDLKLLNRAFYMKSIEQIDTFIREHMLVESTNESMANLIQHVAQASEITVNIQRCETKLREIEQIIKEMTSFEKLTREKVDLEARAQLVGVYPDWQALQDLKVQIHATERDLGEGEALFPGALETERGLEQELERLMQFIAQDDVAAAIRELELRRDELKGRIARLQENELKITELCAGLELKTPRAAKDLNRFQEKITDAQRASEEAKLEVSEQLTKLRQEKGEIDIRSESLRAEIRHLSEHSTQIESELYAVKTLCARELDLPAGALSFVGELIAIRPKESSFEVAIEAALQPISRTLLCLPEHLERVTRWLNEKGLSRTVTIKRIKPKELEAQLRPKFPEDCILSKIELLPIRKNPFFNYLWSWLGTHFDHRIVEVQALKKTEGRAVTPKGLVKTDERTMRKLKENFGRALGWDNEEKIKRLTEELGELQLRLTRLNQSLTSAQKHAQVLDLQGQSLAVLKATEVLYLPLPEVRAECALTLEKIDELEKKGKKLAQLKREKEQTQVRLNEAKERRFEIGSRIDHAKVLLPQLRKRKDSNEGFLQEWLSRPLPGQDRSLTDVFPEVEKELRDIGKNLVGGNWRALQTEIHEEVSRVELRLQQSRLSTLLSQYEAVHHDPDLHYVVPLPRQIPAALAEWGRASEEIAGTGLPQARKKWMDFYNAVLFESVKTAANDIRMEQSETKRSISAINTTLKLTDYERLPSEKRYLQIELALSHDERIRKFNADLKMVEKTLIADARMLVDREISADVMEVLQNFVASLEGAENTGYFSFVTDVRNHFRFSVKSLSRSQNPNEPDREVETFSGSRTDAKSSGQTVQLAYTLLASSLAYRFQFHDPSRGRDTLRLIVLDEFGGKLDNEKPKDIVRLLDDLGFQSVFVSPMSKADLLAGSCGNLVFCHKLSASESKMGSTRIESRSMTEIQASLGQELKTESPAFAPL